MHKRVKDLVDYGKLCGFNLEGQDGKEHYLLRHPNGEVVKVACTPGDYRGDDNCMAEMRRKSGVSPPRPNAGKYRKGVGRREEVPHLASEFEALDSSRAEYYTRRHRQLSDQLRSLQGGTKSPSTLDRARTVIAEMLSVEAELSASGRPVPKRTFRVGDPDAV